MRSLALVLLVVSAPARAQLVWVHHGPGPSTDGQVENIAGGEVVGAINVVAPHPADANIIYAGAANGGVWKTTNATAATPTWVELLGLGRSLAIGALEFDPTDASSQTVVAGTGVFSSFGSGGDRAGLWRTTDGGATWTGIDGGGTLVGVNISGVAPRGATMVVSATNGGILRTTNTGATWTTISGAAASGLPAGIAFDLASDPSNNARLFTSAGANGIYRSTDTGATWTKVSDAAIDALLTADGRVEIAVGPSNSVFVAVVRNRQLAGLFRSGDGGATWTALDLPATVEDGGLAAGIHPGSQGNIHLSVAADPTDPNIVYVGGDRQPSFTELSLGTFTFPNSVGARDFSGRLFRVDASQPAGSQAAHITHSNTAASSAPHADSRDMAFAANGDLIEGDDGGIYRRTNPRTNAGDWFSIIGNISVAEFHDAAWDSVSKIVIAGAQDTGTPQQRTAVNPRWQSVSTSDGGGTVVDDTGTPGVSVRYSSFYDFQSFRRRTYDAANTLQTVTRPNLTVTGGGAALVTQFYTPLRLNNVDPSRLIIGGGNSVYESLDQGDTISEIGPGTVVNDLGRDPIAYGAAGNTDALYVGAGDQVVVRTAAAPAALTSSAAYPGRGTGRWVMGIAIHPASPQTAFVVDRTHVYRTTDYGATWTDVTGNLLALAPGSLLSVTFSTSNPDGTVIVGSNAGVFAARGPAFTAWSALGTGLPRAPVWSLEYDATDEMLLAGTLGRGAWTLNLHERAPVDVALVLDLSGSMLSPACPSCSPKLDVLKDAIELFVQLWTAFTVPNDRIGVEYFRTNVTEFTVGAQALVPVAPNAAAIVADVRGQSTVPTNLTAMGGGIQTAINRMTDATRPRHVVLFTDGMQNVNPMVDSTTFVIDDQPNRPASGVAPTSPPTDLDAALGMRVNTIGVGATPAFVDLLSDIAAETGGLFKLTTAPDEDLRRFYVEELVNVLRAFSPQLLGYRKGTIQREPTTETFTSSTTARRIVLKASTRRGSKIELRVEKDGVDLTRHGRWIAGDFYRIFSMDLPATVDGRTIAPGGDWHVRIGGTSGAAYEAAAIVEEATLKYDFAIEGKDHVVGRPLELRVRLTADRLPVADANVSARMLVPRKGLGTLLSTTATPAEATAAASEPAATVGQRKLQLLLARDESFFRALQPGSRTIPFRNNGDGTYSASFGDTNTEGTYTVVFEVRGSRPDLGTYARTELRSASVRFDRAVLDRSALRLRLLGSTPDGRRYELSLRPVDAHGNHLGPDWDHKVSVELGGRPAGRPIDRGDGTYVFTLHAPPEPTDPTLHVRVMDAPLFEGPISRVPGEHRRLALSLHAGATRPVRDFDRVADPGLLAELDLEYRLTTRVSLEAVAGRYGFGGEPRYVLGATAYAKAYQPAGDFRLFAAAGAGGYRPRDGDAAVGVSVVAGVNRPITTRVEAELRAAYFRVFDDEDPHLEFAAVGAGVKVVF